MTITIGGTDYHLPDTLADMTVQQQMDWSAKFGGFLYAERVRIENAAKLLPPLPDNENDANDVSDALRAMYDQMDLERLLLSIDTAIFSLSFWGEIPEDQLQLVNEGDLLAAYATSQVCLAAELREQDPAESYEFAGATWKISPPFVGVDPAAYSSDQAKVLIKLAKAFTMMSRQDWAGAPYVLAAYFRQVVDEDGNTEALDPAWFVPGSDRYNLMLTVTMDIALAVMTYLADSMTVYLASLNTYLQTATGEDEEPGDETPLDP